MHVFWARIARRVFKIHIGGGRHIMTTSFFEHWPKFAWFYANSTDSIMTGRAAEERGRV